MTVSPPTGPHFLRSLLAAGFVALCALGLAPQAASAHADARADGAQTFANSGCEHCHGATGEGTKKGPSLLDVRQHMKADQIKDQIRHGGKSMPAFGDALDDAQLESLVKLLRSKKWPPIPAPTAQ